MQYKICYWSIGEGGLALAQTQTLKPPRAELGRCVATLHPHQDSCPHFTTHGQIRPNYPIPSQHLIIMIMIQTASDNNDNFTSNMLCFDCDLCLSLVVSTFHNIYVGRLTPPLFFSSKNRVFSGFISYPLKMFLLGGFIFDYTLYVIYYNK